MLFPISPFTHGMPFHRRVLRSVAMTLALGGLLTQALLFPTSLSQASLFQAAVVGYWKLDETTGSTAYNRSGNNNHVTLRNFANTSDSRWTTGNNGDALAFSGDIDILALSSTIDITIYDTALTASNVAKLHAGADVFTLELDNTSVPNTSPLLLLALSLPALTLRKGA